MAGFLGNTTSFSLFEAPVPQRMDFADAARALPFSDAVTPEGKRMGWVGLGNAVDTDFSFGIDHGRFVALSLRVDSRKASGAALKLQLAEAVQAELAQGKKVSGKRKKELKEAITAKLISRAEWTPALTDCLWDLENGRLLVAASPKAALPLLAQFKATFGVDAQAFAAGAELPSFFARLSREDVALNGWELSCAGSATLATSAQTEDKGAVAVQNCESSIASALNEGLTIQKLAMTAVPADTPDVSLSFSLDTSMTVSGLKLPKAEKGADADTDFLLKADTCARTADLALHIAGLA